MDSRSTLNSRQKSTGRQFHQKTRCSRSTPRSSGLRRDQPIPDDGEDEPEVQDEPDDTSSQLPLLTNQLLDRLLYKGVLPRYAFPTDVATFYVFDRINSTSYRPAFHFTPSQGLSVALTQYAPGKKVWIAGQRIHFGSHLFSDCQGAKPGMAEQVPVLRMLHSATMPRKLNSTTVREERRWTAPHAATRMPSAPQRYGCARQDLLIRYTWMKTPKLKMLRPAATRPGRN